MKLQVNKKKLKNLSNDAQMLPAEATPKIGGGAFTDWAGCTTHLEETAYNCPSDQHCGTGQCVTHRGCPPAPSIRC